MAHSTFTKTRYRTHRAAELGSANAGELVRIAGFLQRRRDHGKVLFLDVRDASGVVQCVLDEASPAYEAARALSLESVVTVGGLVGLRPEGATNPSLASGAIELRVSEIEVHSAAEPLPFALHDADEPSEELRLRYRFLDLRRERMRKNLLLRAALIAELRRSMTERGFVEFQTPILTASSPEGARDFLVPSRVHPGKFYALPQAPQVFKQLLMASGFERYFQIAPCFRDEDARADRSPGEFYQLDVELAYVEQDDVFAAIEPVLFEVFSKFGGSRVTAPPFPRISHATALLAYGTDKPDLRNPLRMVEATQAARAAGLVSGELAARALSVPAASLRSRSALDRICQEAAGGAHIGYLWGASGSLAKRFAEVARQELMALSGAAAGDAVLLIWGAQAAVQRAGAALIARLGRELDLLEKNAFRWCWVTDFPFYEVDPDSSRIDFAHNPFSMPQGGLEALSTQAPERILAHQYDIVCNGVELSSGAIRNHRPDIMLKAFEIAGYDATEVERRFGALLRAFRFGAPPHGGLAPGIDRMVMLLSGEPNIREIVAFPMTQNAEDLLTGAPAEVSQAALDELHLRLVEKRPS